MDTKPKPQWLSHQDKKINLFWIVYFQIQNWEQYFTKKLFFTLSKRIEILKEIEMGEGKKPTVKNYRRLSWMRRGNSLYPFALKPNMTSLSSYSMLSTK